MKAFAHHCFHFGRKQSAGLVVSPCNIFLIFSSLEANLQQRKKIKEHKAKCKPPSKASCLPRTVPIGTHQVGAQCFSSLGDFEWTPSLDAIETCLFLQFPPLPHVEGTAFQHSVTSHLCDFRDVLLTGWVLHNLSVNGKLKGL